MISAHQRDIGIDPSGMDTSVVSLIAHAEKGDASAADALFTLLYGELHRLAKAQLARSPGDLTLGTTTLLHEAYLDMAGREQAVFPDRARPGPCRPRHAGAHHRLRAR